MKHINEFNAYTKDPVKELYSKAMNSGAYAIKELTDKHTYTDEELSQAAAIAADHNHYDTIAYILDEYTIDNHTLSTIILNQAIIHRPIFALHIIEKFEPDLSVDDTTALTTATMCVRYEIVKLILQDPNVHIDENHDAVEFANSDKVFTNKYYTDHKKISKLQPIKKILDVYLLDPVAFKTLSEEDLQSMLSFI